MYDDIWTQKNKAAICERVKRSDVTTNRVGGVRERSLFGGCWKAAKEHVTKPRTGSTGLQETISRRL